MPGTLLLLLLYFIFFQMGKNNCWKFLAVNFHSRKRNHAQCPSCYCWSSTFKETSSLSCCWFRTLELLGSHFRNLSGQNLQKKMQQQKSSDRMGAFQMWKSWTVMKSNKQPEKKKIKIKILPLINPFSILYSKSKIKNHRINNDGLQSDTKFLGFSIQQLENCWIYERR